MKFTKYNNPNRRRKARRSTYSSQYRQERKEELYRLLAQCETDSQKDALIKAYDLSVNP